MSMLFHVKTKIKHLSDRINLMSNPCSSPSVLCLDLSDKFEFCLCDICLFLSFIFSTITIIILKMKNMSLNKWFYFHIDGTHFQMNHSCIADDLLSPQLVHIPSRMTENLSTIIDHVYCTNLELFSKVLSDQYPDYVTISISLKMNKSKTLSYKNTNHKTITYQCHISFDESAFLCDLELSNLINALTPK